MPPLGRPAQDGPGSSTYARFKDVASQSGNPVK